MATQGTRAQQDRRTVGVLLTLVVGLGLVHVVFAEDTVGDAAFVAAFVAVSTLAGFGVRRSAPGHRLVPALVAAGIGSSSIGDIIGLAYSRSGESPNASWADPFYISAWSLLAVALVLVLVHAQRRRGLEAVLDALTIVTISVLVVWHFSIAGYIFDAADSALARIAISAYAVADAVVLGLLVRVVLEPRTRGRSTSAFVVGAIIWLSTDIIYLALGAEGRLLDVLDLGWLVGSAVLALAVRDAGTTGRDEPAPVDGRRAHYRRLAISVLPLLVPVGLIALGSDDDVPAQLVGLLVLIGFTVVRTGRLLDSERRAQADLVVARDAALEASRAKSAFLATMSHEIRTPMNAVLGLTGLLRTTELDERQRGFASGAEAAGHELLDLLNDILDFSRVEAGELVLDDVDFDLAEVLDQVAEQVVDRTRAADLELLVRWDPDVPLGLRGDPERLQQVLLHLVGNALKFTGSGEVVVAVHREPGDPADPTAVVLRLEVSDTGVGIAPTDQTRVFEPFAQADESTTRRYGGTGLGLAVVQRLVAAMAGQVGVRSTLGEGSTFWFTIPLRLASDPLTAPALATGSLAGVRVLIVDDNATQRTILLEQTRAWGMEPTAVAGGLEALVALTGPDRLRNGYDLALLDLCMPGMDGLQLADRINGLRAPRPGVVLLTSGPEVSAIDAAVAGVASRLAKPASLPRLRRALLEALGAGEEAAPAVPPTHRGHLLVVGSPGVDRSASAGVLADLGYTLEVVDEVRAGLQRLRATPYDAVLVDVRLSGTERLLSAVRRRDPDRPVPVVGMSGADDADPAPDGLVDLLATPVSSAAANAVLERLVPAAARSCDDDHARSGPSVARR